MKLEAATISSLTQLARLSLDHATNMQADLEHIADLIAQISTVSTQGIEPMAHPSALHQALRPDVVTEPDQSQTLLALGPSVAADLFLVPTVLE